MTDSSVNTKWAATAFSPSPPYCIAVKSASKTFSEVVLKAIILKIHDEFGCYYTVNTPKTKAGEREIPMTPEVRAAFEMEKAYQQELGLVSLDNIDGYENFVFLTQDGHAQNQSNLNKAIKRIIRDKYRPSGRIG